MAAQLVETTFPRIRWDAVSSRAESRVPGSLKATCSPAHGQGLTAAHAVGLPGSELVPEGEMKTESGCRLQELEQSG